MGSKDIPLAPARNHIKAFEKLSCENKGRHDRGKGSHVVLKAPNGMLITVPDHKEVKRNLLASEIKQAGFTIKQYVKAYKEAN